MRHPRNSGQNDDDLKRKLSPGTLRDLLELARPYTRALIGAGILALLSTVTSLAIPWLVRDAANRLSVSTSLVTLDRDAALVFLLVAFGGLLSYAQYVVSARIGNRIVNELRLRLFAHLQRLPVSYFDTRRSGDLTSYLSNDVSQLQTVLTNDLARAAANVVALVGGISLAVILNWRLTIVVVTLLMLGLAFFIFCGIRLKKLNRESLDALALAMGGITEALGNIRLVKAFDRETYEDRRVESSLNGLFGIAMRAARLEGVMVAVGGSAFFMMLLGLLWFGARGVVAGTFKPGDVISFVVVLMVIVQPMTSLATLYTSLQRGAGAAERIFGILRETSEPADTPDAVEFPEGDQAVRFEEVHFSYLPEVPVLRGLNLELLPGKVTALVGASGSGKSTVASLLFRFYEPTSGSIKIGNVSVAEVRRHALRSHVGMVPQEPYLFSGTLFENIRYGDVEATDEAVRRAAELANVSEFTDRLPEGFQTLVGERGVTLSGGQRQRVAIARAILKNPRILILDEATSALDNRSEALVREALDRLMAGRTTLVIAHRLSTVQNADQIAVMAEGKILEQGDHTSLIARKGAYFELIRAGEKNLQQEVGQILEEVTPSF